MNAFKFSAILAALWLGIVLGGGFLGRKLLGDVSRAVAEADFARDARAIQGVLASRTWASPAEDDPTWAEIERQFNLSMVPISKVVASGTGQLPANSSVRWQVSDAGADRIIQTLTIQVPTLPSLSGLRVTREVARNPSGRMWLRCSLGLAGISCMFMLAAAAAFFREQQDILGLLQSWLESTSRTRTQGQLLTPIDSAEIRSRQLMSLIASGVNSAYDESMGLNERTELVLGNLREGVMAVDDKANVLLANRALRGLLSIEVDRYLYRPLLEVSRAPVIADLVTEVLREQTPRENTCEFGEPPKHLRLVARPLPLGSKRVGVLLTVRDESLIKRAELIRRDFVANASHELKTPLAAIRAYAETLQMGAIDDREVAVKFVGNIISQADRINGLVQGMLQLSRVEVGQVLNFQEFDLLAALAPCLAAAEAVAQAKGVKLVPPAATKTAALIRSDRDGVQTIVGNLLSNAVAYTQAGGTVWLQVVRDDAHWSIEVSDTGIGMQPTDLKRAFERFYRAEKDRSTETGGTGLGLSIVKHLTHALGGSVEAKSVPGHGSNFTVLLPLAAELAPSEVDSRK